MGGWNLPPGVSVSDIPGNRPIDGWRDEQKGKLDRGLKQAYRHAYRLDPEHEEAFTQNLVAFLQENGYERVIQKTQDEELLEGARRDVNERLDHFQMHDPDATPEGYAEDLDVDVSTESWEHLRRDLLYDRLPERLHDKVQDPDWWKEKPVSCPDCEDPRFGGSYCEQRVAVALKRKGNVAYVEDDHGQRHSLRCRARDVTVGDLVHIEYAKTGYGARWTITEHYPTQAVEA